MRVKVKAACAASFLVVFVIGSSAPAGAATPPHTRVFLGGATYTVSEGAGAASITVHRNGNLSGSTSVEVTLTNGTAIAPGDYANNGPFSFTFASKEKKKTFTIPIVNDTADEADETVNIALAFVSGSGGLGNPSTSVLTIVDNDLSGSNIAMGNASGSESVGSLVFEVTLTPAASQPVSVHYQTNDETATAGSDYTASSGTVTFAPGDVSENVAIPITNDTIDEFDEHFVVDLSAPSNAVISDPGGVGNITDNDVPAVLAISDTSADEGDPMIFDVTLNGPSGKTITVYVESKDDDSTTGAYVQTNDTLTFSPGETTKQFSVDTVEDSAPDSDEVVYAIMGPATNATLVTEVCDCPTDHIGRGEIVDDDTADTTAPTATNATVDDEDADNFLTAGDTITIDFSETMNTTINDAAASGLDDGDGFVYNSPAAEVLTCCDGWSWIDSDTLQVALPSTFVGFCNPTPDPGCALGSDISSVSADGIEDVAGNDWALGGDKTLEGQLTDVTAPTSLFAVVAENGPGADNNLLSVGDVITIVFDEPIAGGDIDLLEGLEYNNIEHLAVGSEAQYELVTPNILQISITGALGICPFDPACAWGHDITDIDADFLQDLSGHEWALGGDKTIEETNVTASIDNVFLQDCAVLPSTFCNVNPSMHFTVTLSGTLPFDTPIGFDFEDGSAVVHVDYSPAPSPVTLTSGNTTKTISALIHDNGRGCEGAEWLKITVTSLPGARLLHPVGAGTIFDIDCQDESEPNNTPATADPVAPAGFPNEGVLPVADVDYYSIAATAGDVIEATTRGACEGDLADTVVTIYSTDGTTVLATDDDGGDGLCSHAGFGPVATTGTYFLKVEEFGDDFEIAYEIRASATS